MPGHSSLTLTLLESGSCMHTFEALLSSDSSLPPAGPLDPKWNGAASFEGDAASDVDWLLDDGDDGDGAEKCMGCSCCVKADSFRPLLPLLPFLLSRSSPFFFFDLFDFFSLTLVTPDAAEGPLAEDTDVCFTFRVRLVAEADDEDAVEVVDAGDPGREVEAVRLKGRAGALDDAMGGCWCSGVSIIFDSEESASGNFRAWMGGFVSRVKNNQRGSIRNAIADQIIITCCCCDRGG